MFIVLLTKKLCKLYILQLELIIFSLFSHFLQKYRKGENDNNLQILHVRKIWLFGYQCEGLLHACISSSNYYGRHWWPRARPNVFAPPAIWR